MVSVNGFLESYVYDCHCIIDLTFVLSKFTFVLCEVRFTRTTNIYHFLLWNETWI